MIFFLSIIIFIPCFILLMLLIKFLIRLDLPRGYLEQKKKEQLEKQGDEIEEQFVSQFSPENLSSYEKWEKTFVLENGVVPFSSIPDDIKKKIIIECICIEGLKEEDKSFVANTLYRIVVENASLIKNLRDFLLKKLNLKYKYLAEKIIKSLMNEVYHQFHMAEKLYELDDE